MSFSSMLVYEAVKCIILRHVAQSNIGMVGDMTMARCEELRSARSDAIADVFEARRQPARDLLGIADIIMIPRADTEPLGRYVLGASNLDGGQCDITFEQRAC